MAAILGIMYVIGYFITSLIPAALLLLLAYHILKKK